MKIFTVPKEDNYILIYDEKDEQIYKVVRYEEHGDNYLVLSKVDESDFIR